MDSKIGLLIQVAGVSLITLLTLFLRRSLNVIALKHWTNAWLCLSFALFCMRLAFSFGAYSTQLFSFYFFNEYLFGFLVFAGCRSLRDQGDLPIRQEILILPFIIIAFGLPFVSGDFNLVLNLHALILACFFLASFVELARNRIGSFGWKVMLIALALLVIDHSQYLLTYVLGHLVHLPDGIQSYTTIFELVIQILLGFGMVIVLLEIVLKNTEDANENLKEAKKKLEEMATRDPLTEALNRHAFHGYLNRHGNEGGRVTGSVGFFDIDDLKTINDVYGHAVGDFAIRAVVRAIREIIRGEDLVFRWGGDEFFVLMVGLDAESATARLSRMEQMLTNVRIEGIYQQLTIRVSHAFEDFDDLSRLEATIEKADAKMYLQKQIRKGTIPPPVDRQPSNELIYK